MVKRRGRTPQSLQQYRGGGEPGIAPDWGGCRTVIYWVKVGAGTGEDGVGKGGNRTPEIEARAPEIGDTLMPRIGARRARNRPARASGLALMKSCSRSNARSISASEMSST
eukprot:scaffold3694_cov104-Isochrysis_galbana.AAC.1